MLYITPSGLLSNLKFVHYLYPFCPPSQLLAPVNQSINLFSVSMSFGVFFLFHIKSEITQYLSFSVWLISLSITSSRSIYVVANGKISFSFITATAKSRQSCPTLCDPIEGSPTGSPDPGILQARILEWVAISFSNA